jgi:hypothetical protein
MTGRVGSRWWAAALLLAPSAAFAQQPPQVSASVDRTAVWVADRVTYTVDIVCAPGVDVLMDDLAKERLRVTGLEFVSTDATAASDATGRTTHHVRYVLTTYRVDTPTLAIEPSTVRYYAARPGQRLQEMAPAGEVKIPGALVAFRSTLPDNPSTSQLRDGRAAEARPWFFARARQLGLAAIVLSLAPAAFVFAGAIRRRTRAVASKRSKRRTRADHRARVERLRSLDVATEEERRRAYDEISAAVREHVAERSHVPALALTAQEIDAALESSGGRLPRESITPLLATCDAARYAPAQALPSAEQCRDALATAEQLLHQ